MRSIITNNLKVCYLCGSTENVELHHCIHGKEGRKLSTQYHLLVGLCSECHRGPKGVHSKDGILNDYRLRSEAQECWILRRMKKGEVANYVHGVCKWREIFGEDYTDEYYALLNNS